ncbi:general secretion pathway protein GspC [Desulfatiferula olefinivorans]
MVDRYFTLANLILITAFIGLGTGTFYKVLTHSLTIEEVRPAARTVPTSSRAETAARQSFAAYSQVAGRNLFRVDDEVPPQTTADLKLDDMEKTDLQLTLWGTISGGGALAFAVIEEKTTRQQALYKVGDRIQDATLTHVLRNKVVLNVNGKDQILEVSDAAGMGGTPGHRMMPAPDYADAAPSGPPSTITVEREMIDESLKDLNKLMKDVRIRPHFKDGEADGLIISGIRGDSVFKQLGLRNGDIILGVDGNKIQSVDDAMKLYGGLKNMENMKVEIKRRGQIQTLDFDIK